MDLVTEIYSVIKSFPKDEIYGLTSQIRRAAISISANIAEGRLRNGNKEFKWFLIISFASRDELEIHLKISKRLGYLDEIRYKELINNLSKIVRMLNGLIKKLESSF